MDVLIGRCPKCDAKVYFKEGIKLINKCGHALKSSEKELTLTDTKDYGGIYITRDISKLVPSDVSEATLVDKNGDQFKVKVQKYRGSRRFRAGEIHEWKDRHKKNLKKGNLVRMTALKDNCYFLEFLSEKTPTKTLIPKSQTQSKVFIVHGHDEEMLANVRLFLLQQEIEEIVLREEPNIGTRALIDKFEKYSSDVTTAIILISPDDLGFPKNKNIDEALFRARQNVVFEFGYFFGKLDRNRIIPIVRVKKNLELPSDYLGITYIDYNKKNWPKKLAEELIVANFSQIDKRKIRI